MKRLLRNVIDFQDGRLSDQALEVNFRRLRDSTIEWLLPADQRIFSFVREFWTDSFGPPSLPSALDYFSRSNEIEVVERLEDLRTAAKHDGVNFASLLRDLENDQRVTKLVHYLGEAKEIAMKGLLVGEGRKKETIRGVEAAIQHVSSKGYDLLPSVGQGRERGDVVQDVDGSWDKYQAAKHDKSSAYGRFCGINSIDMACHGLKKGELWLHAAYTGEMKTSFALVWAYNQVTRYRGNVFFASLEMPYDQIRMRIHVLHSANGKWGRPPLDYRKVRDGELSPEDEAFYQEVLTDFQSNPEHCIFEVYCPSKDVGIKDLRTELETFNRKAEVSMAVIDHGGLVESRKTNRDYTIELNAVLRDAKKLALQFDGGKGVPVLMLFQLNRDGKDDADKNDGRYKLRALAQANEAERSADYVTTSYLNDYYREAGKVKFGNLKNRDNPLFAPFTAEVKWSCHLIYEDHGDRGAVRDVGIGTDEADLVF